MWLSVSIRSWWRLRKISSTGREPKLNEDLTRTEKLMQTGRGSLLLLLLILWLVGKSKCCQAKQATLRFTNIHHTLFLSSPSTKTNLPAAPLSTFAPPLTFTCNQTQWLHDAVGATSASTPLMWTEKSRSDEKQKILPCTTSATALPRTVHRHLLQRPPHSRPF